MKNLNLWSSKTILSQRMFRLQSILEMESLIKGNSSGKMTTIR